MGKRTGLVTFLLATVLSTVMPLHRAEAAPSSSPTSIAECATSWRLVKTDVFRGTNALTRSQGVTTDGNGWIFSWQLGVERTNDAYATSTAGLIAPKVLLDGGVHIGGIDTYNGLVYAPVEDPNYGPVNDPEYQRPYISLLDAHNLRPTGRNIKLDKSIHEAGVPWIAIDASKKLAYTAEWDMKRDRLNVFDTDMHFKRFLPLVYPPSLGAGFRLNRIQGAKVFGNTLFVARDDAKKSVFGVDLTTGVISPRFTLNRPGDEIEGLTVRPTGDGALVHVLVIRDGDDYVKYANGKLSMIRVEFQHWAPVASDACTSSDQSLANAADVDNVVHFEQLMADHLHEGHAVEVDFATKDKVPGQVVGTGGWGDSGLWTGVYLGGEAMRYQVAKKHLADPSITDGDRAFWTGQRDEAMQRARLILAAEHRDINIAEDWTGELRLPPDVNTDDPTGRHLANFGGGVIHGEKGMIQRSCTPVGQGRLGINDPTSYPDKPVNNNDNRVFRITWTHGDGRTYNCETSPSRDTYAGLTFGLLTAYDMVGPDAPDLQKQIRTDLQAMGDFLWKYGWAYPRPHGYVSAQHDFNGFISPLFVYTPEARLNLTNAVRHVLADGDDVAAAAKWNAIWASEFASQGAALGPSHELDAMTPFDSYYKWNLSHLIAFNLLRTTSGAERALLAAGMAPMDQTTKDDVNAHFEAIMYSVTGEQQRLADATTHLRQWLDYRANIEAGPVHNEDRCGHDIKCVPEDQATLNSNYFDGGSFTYGNGSSYTRRAKNPLPVAQRVPTDFLWQRPPNQLNGSEAPTHRAPGIDFLTPYWMIRYLTEVAPPALRPLPHWPLPAHS
jgi:hypothetical protein